eukprot:6201446-Pleurochrysis_carterae.AAC.1
MHTLVNAPATPLPAAAPVTHAFNQRITPLVLVLSRAVVCKSTPIDASTNAYLTDASCATYDAPR